MKRDYNKLEGEKKTSISIPLWMYWAHKEAAQEEMVSETEATRRAFGRYIASVLKSETPQPWDKYKQTSSASSEVAQGEALDESVPETEQPLQTKPESLQLIHTPEGKYSEDPRVWVDALLEILESRDAQVKKQHPVQHSFVFAFGANTPWRH